MTVPRRLLELIDLTRDAASGADRQASGPWRVEVDAALLEKPPAALPENLRRALRAATFIGVHLTARSTRKALAHALDLAAAGEAWLDLGARGTAGLVRGEGEAKLRIARLRWRFDHARDLFRAEVPARLAAEAALIAGRAVLDLRVEAPDAPRIAPLLAELASGPAPVDVVLDPADARAHEALAAAWEAIALNALEHRVNVAVRGGARTSPGAPLDPVHEPNVLAHALRAVVRRHPERCPFPFLMLRFREDGAVLPCPWPQGPPLERTSAEPWNDAAMLEVRRGFFSGSLPAPCRACALFPRVRASLEAR